MSIEQIKAIKLENKRISQDIASLQQRMRELSPANWQVHEDNDALCLQIELGNDFAVTLNVWKQGDPPCVGLWQGSGSRELQDQDVESFREWLNQARGVS